MDIDKALDLCLAEMLGPSERLLTLAAGTARKAGRKRRPLAVAEPELPSGPARPLGARNRAVLRRCGETLRQTLGQLAPSVEA